MSYSTGRVAVPGDEIEIEAKTTHVILGPGLIQKNEHQAVAIRAGVLHFKAPNSYWLESYLKKYWPARGDCVVGQIMQKAGDNYRVNIWGPEPATLSSNAFEGATKKHKPNLKPGDLVYCQVISAHKVIEPEVVCVNSYERRGPFGVLESETSNLITVPLQLVHLLLLKECPLLKALGKKLQYEVVIGQNGKIWVNGNTIKNTLAIGSALKACSQLNLQQIRDMCERIAGT